MMMRDGKRGRAVLLATGVRCTCSPKRSSSGIATPARPLRENSWVARASIS